MQTRLLVLLVLLVLTDSGSDMQLCALVNSDTHYTNNLSSLSILSRMNVSEAGTLTSCNQQVLCPFL